MQARRARARAKAACSAAQVDFVVHATTVATNAIIEGKIAAQRLRDDRRLPRPARDRAPGAPDALRHAVREAAAARPAGPRRRRRRAARRRAARCCSPLDDELGARGRGAAPSAKSVESVAVCLLHSYVNPEHEQRVGAILAEELPGVPDLALGRGRARVPRVPARLDDGDQRRDPAGRGALPRADRGAPRRGGGRGQAARDAVERRRLRRRGRRERPVFMVESGPAAGVIAAAYLGRDARPSATSSRSTWAARPRRSA